ncbi:methyltransferase domain-containing protein [Pseudactinotalea suaedae]|uniref:methyltransferase domain-containing protein n=1 Tax=Pseudactinotalea suaedae TaxID=1524924 RepID=UPI0012E3086D|nr:methyltransferase domain-containing protein [Pseudactinotalea suaedae]
MHCSYMDAGRCCSATRIEIPYPEQLATKQRVVSEALGPMEWAPAFPSAEAGFRNKAKMVVAGTVEQPTLGILGPGGLGIDLAACPLHERPVVTAMPVLREMVTRAGLTPYSVPDRRGELKLILVTGSPAGELMIRFVLRSTEALPRLRKHLDWLREKLPNAVVISANLLPTHVALTEGETEIPFTEKQLLTMRTNEIDLLLRPGGFFQTNTAVAAALYRQAAAWASEASPRSVADLYCGVGGFALHLAGPDREVVGVEVSAEAVDGARVAAARRGTSVRFEVGDATAVEHLDADLVVVNPPRRGIGDLAARLDASHARHVLYSSCNPTTLARDLAEMPSLRPVRARLFDMFPHNHHAEVLVLLERAVTKVR